MSFHNLNISTAANTLVLKGKNNCFFKLINSVYDQIFCGHKHVLAKFTEVNTWFLQAQVSSYVLFKHWLNSPQYYTI